MSDVVKGTVRPQPRCEKEGKPTPVVSTTVTTSVAVSSVSVATTISASAESLPPQASLSNPSASASHGVADVVSSSVTAIREVQETTPLPVVSQINSMPSATIMSEPLIHPK